MSREGALWVGGLESYMDEPFLQRALQLMGEAPPLSIKVGWPAGSWCSAPEQECSCQPLSSGLLPYFFMDS